LILDLGSPLDFRGFGYFPATEAKRKEIESSSHLNGMEKA